MHAIRCTQRFTPHVDDGPHTVSRADADIPGPGAYTNAESIHVSNIVGRDFLIRTYVFGALEFPMACVSTGLRVYVCLCVCVRGCESMNVCMYVCTYVRTYVGVFVYVCYVCVYMHAFMYAPVCMCCLVHALCIHRLRYASIRANHSTRASSRTRF